MELFKGSPSDLGGRQDREIRVYRFLDELGIEYERTDHPDEPATTMEACEKIDAVLDVKICKNLVFCNKVSVIVNKLDVYVRLKRLTCFICFCLLVHKVGNESSAALLACTAAEREADFTAVGSEPVINFVNGTFCNRFSA